MPAPPQPAQPPVAPVTVEVPPTVQEARVVVPPFPAAVVPPAPRYDVSRPEPPAYHPVSPVELTFDDEQAPVGVRPGTRTYEEFQRCASALFSELRRVRPS